QEHGVWWHSSVRHREDVRHVAEWGYYQLARQNVTFQGWLKLNSTANLCRLCTRKLHMDCFHEAQGVVAIKLNTQIAHISGSLLYLKHMKFLHRILHSSLIYRYSNQL
ncbi:hypothetical protein GDO86_004582, partial [Hymenochirus boettgeri]